MNWQLWVCVILGVVALVFWTFGRLLTSYLNELEAAEENLHK
jgi:glucose uptake protein GlcU